jgi:hypothetical protein
MILFLLIGWFTPYWECYFFVVYGYFVRILAGPRLCPTSWFELLVIYPIVNRLHLLENDIVPSAPKWFAQLGGLFFSVAYVVLMYFHKTAARVLSIIHTAICLLAATTGICIYSLVYSAFRDSQDKQRTGESSPSSRSYSDRHSQPQSRMTSLRDVRSVAEIGSIKLRSTTSYDNEPIATDRTSSSPFRKFSLSQSRGRRQSSKVIVVADSTTSESPTKNILTAGESRLCEAEEGRVGNANITEDDVLKEDQKHPDEVVEFEPPSHDENGVTI